MTSAYSNETKAGWHSGLSAQPIEKTAWTVAVTQGLIEARAKNQWVIAEGEGPKFRGFRHDSMTTIHAITTFFGYRISGSAFSIAFSLKVMRGVPDPHLLAGQSI